MGKRREKDLDIYILFLLASLLNVTVVVFIGFMAVENTLHKENNRKCKYTVMNCESKPFQIFTAINTQDCTPFDIPDFQMGN